jgi:uncharacterized membrane protein YjdF
MVGSGESMKKPPISNKDSMYKYLFFTLIHNQYCMRNQDGNEFERVGAYFAGMVRMEVAVSIVYKLTSSSMMLSVLIFSGKLVITLQHPVRLATETT